MKSGAMECWRGDRGFKPAFDHHAIQIWRVPPPQVPQVKEGGGWSITFYPGEFEAKKLRRIDYLVQPSTFWDKVGPLDQSMVYAFDWEWFLRSLEICRFEYRQSILSIYRFHDSHKSGMGGDARMVELIEVTPASQFPGICFNERMFLFL
jgi:hypothetical protein